MKMAMMFWLMLNCCVWHSLAGFSLYLRLNMPKTVFNGFMTIATLFGGLEWTEEPPVLRFFVGKLKPIGDWVDKLVAKFREGFWR